MSAFALATLALSVLPLFAGATPVRRAATKQIHPNGDVTKCLSVFSPGNDVPTVIAPCASTNGTQYSTWTIAPGDNTVVQLTGTSFCLDAGTNPHNNGPAKVYTCYPGLGQQRWWYTDDEHIAITGGNQCLDSAASSGGLPQTYQCTGGNTNQIWSLTDASSPVTSSTSSTPTGTATSSTVSSSTPTSTPPATANNGTQIRFNLNGTDACLTVNNGYAAQGTNVVLTGCFSPSHPAIGLQLWTLKRNAAGPIQLTLPQHGDNYCLDFGSTPASGTTAKIWNCYDGLFQQTFWYTTDNRIALYNGDQCLDVVKESQPTQTKPYGTLKDVQSWKCTTGDTQQVWTSSV